jgi:hypothetical protein
MCSVIVGNIVISVLMILLYLVHYGIVQSGVVDICGTDDYLMYAFSIFLIKVAIILSITLSFSIYDGLSDKDGLLLKYIQFIIISVYVLSFVVFHICVYRFKKDCKLYQKIKAYFDIDLEELVDDFVDLDSRNNKVAREKLKRLRKLFKMSKYFDTDEAKQEFLNEIVEKELDNFINLMNERSAKIHKENEEKHNQTLIKDKELLKQFKKIYGED